MDCCKTGGTITTTFPREALILVMCKPEIFVLAILKQLKVLESPIYLKIQSEMDSSNSSKYENKSTIVYKLDGNSNESVVVEK